MSHSAVLFSISVDTPHHLTLHEDIKKLTLQEPKGRNDLNILCGSSLNLRPSFVLVLKLDDTLCYLAVLSKASLVKSEYSGYEYKGNSSRCATIRTHCWDRKPKSPDDIKCHSLFKRVPLTLSTISLACMIDFAQALRRLVSHCQCCHSMITIAIPSLDTHIMSGTSRTGR